MNSGYSAGDAALMAACALLCVASAALSGAVFWYMWPLSPEGWRAVARYAALALATVGFTTAVAGVVLAATMDSRTVWRLSRGKWGMP